MSTTARIGRGGAAAALLGVLVAACGGDGPSDSYVECGAESVGRSRVTVVGDSLSVQTEGAYQDAIDAVLVDACNGRTIAGPLATDDGVGRMAALQPSQPEWWVVALGTNDAAYGGRPPETVRAAARQLLQAIPAEACVAWVLPAVQSPATPAAAANVAAAGQVITEELGQRSCQAVVDWPAAVASDRSLLGDDGIHLTPAGADRLAALVADATAA